VGDNPVDVIARRSKPRLLILDEELRIVFADWAAMFTIFRVSEDPREPVQRLPEPLYSAIKNAVTTWGALGPAETLVEPLPDVVLRVSRLSGTNQSFVAVFCESRARRDDLAHAARLFALTKREQEVLNLVLHGLRASEIAEELMIAEGTVRDYFKQLLRKTKCKNRTEMIARVLGWADRP
jgi:DNA-binding CsgD family transcriptional regulator